jgi:hypothetical protein
MAYRVHKLRGIKPDEDPRTGFRRHATPTGAYLCQFVNGTNSWKKDGYLGKCTTNEYYSTTEFYFHSLNLQKGARSMWNGCPTRLRLKLLTNKGVKVKSPSTSVWVPPSPRRLSFTATNPIPDRSIHTGFP